MILVYVRFAGNEGKPSESVPGTFTSRHVVDSNDPQEAAALAYEEVKLLHQQAGHPEVVVSFVPFDVKRALKGAK